MKRILIITSLLVPAFLNFLIENYVYSQVAEEWVDRYAGVGPQTSASAVKTDKYGNVYVTGSYLQNGNYNYVTLKYNLSGILQWAEFYNGPGNGDDFASSIEVDSSGNVYITGSSEGAGTHSDFATIKYSSNGDSLWVVRYNSPENSFEGGQSISLDNAGNVYVLGGSYIASINSVEYVTIKYNSSGTEQWVSIYEGSGKGNAAPRKVIADDFGFVYVTGSLVTGPNGPDIVTIKYNSSGVQQWVKIFDDGGGIDEGIDMGQDMNGNIFVGGHSQSLGMVTIKYDPSGAQIWLRSYFGFVARFSAIAVDRFGDVHITGSIIGFPTQHDFVTLKYNSSGIQQWDQIYNGAGNGEDRTYSIGVDNFGNTYVTGESRETAGNLDYTTIKYSYSGNQLWIQNYNGTGNSNDAARALFVDSLDNVYISGSSISTGVDITTIKYIQAPNSPSDLNLQVLSIGGIKLIWTDNSLNEEKFGIERMDNVDTIWTLKDSVPANVTQWKDSGLIVGRTYYYRIYSSNTAGNSPYSNSINTTISSIHNNLQIPEKYMLYQNYPNPFNPVTQIKFDVPKNRKGGMIKVKLEVYNITGQLVTTLVNNLLPAGSYEINWNAINFSSGVYFYKLISSEFIDVKRMVIIK